MGSEGTLGIVTEATVRLSRKPEAVKTLLAIYDQVVDATRTVAAITARGITPAALEMMDGFTLRAVEEATHAGYPMDCAAVLLIEVEGLKEAVEEHADEIEAVCRENQAREVRRAKSAEERDLLWKGRKTAFGALGRISPNYYVQDGVIPRTRLPEMLDFIGSIEKKYDLHIGNIFHAGDGNLHPLIMYDERDREQTARVVKAAKDIIMRCVEMGGSITGEHGVGLEKSDLMPLIFSENDLELMSRDQESVQSSGAFESREASSHRENVRGTTRRIGGGRPGVTLAVDSVRAEMAALVGPSHVLTDPAACAALAVDGKVPDCAVIPVTAEQVAAVLRYASEHHLALIPRGNGTKLSMGNPPRRYDIALSSAELNRVIHYEPADLTISVEAGMTFGEFQDLVGQKRFVAASRSARGAPSRASVELLRRMRRGRCARVSAALATWFWD